MFLHLHRLRQNACIALTQRLSRNLESFQDIRSAVSSLLSVATSSLAEIWDCVTLTPFRHNYEFNAISRFGSDEQLEKDGLISRDQEERT
jgi:hypothetical protein